MSTTKPVKTLAMRVLEGQGVPYQPVYYEVSEHLSAAEVARVIGLPPEQAFKTLVVLPAAPNGRPILALVPGESQLDLKKLAAAVGEKKVQMASQREAERLTGLEKGGISPLALLDRGFRIAADETITLFDHVEISAGKVGAGVIVETPGLLRVLRLVLADITAATAE
jgi:Cys-tRNA(Pro)/Cys-tRNA(Cys) deacylase